jgi:hypothetical protein
MNADLLPIPRDADERRNMIAAYMAGMARADESPLPEGWVRSAHVWAMEDVPGVRVESGA